MVYGTIISGTAGVLGGLNVAQSVTNNVSTSGQQSSQQLHRPYLRQATRQTIEGAAATTKDGSFISPNETGYTFTDNFHYGHIPGREHKVLLKEAINLNMTQPEFNDWVNSHPEWFHIEPAHENFSHMFEIK